MFYRVIILIIAVFLVLSVEQKSFSLDVVYPKKNQVTIDAKSTFFIGSADKDKPLYINGEEVDVHPSGGFAKTVQLKTGENNFVIKSGNKTMLYKITRPANKFGNNIARNNFITYAERKMGVVSYRNCPLRSTPIDDGINRISHLQKDIPLIIDGEQGDFYRVYLSNDNFGWILKSQVQIKEGTIRTKKVNKYKIFDDGDFYTVKVELTGQVPWEIEVSNPTTIKLYNTDTPDNIYTLNLDKKKYFGKRNIIGYSAKFDGNNFIAKYRKPLKIDKRKSLKGIKITVDPGHGGKEYGAIGCLGDKEKDVMLLYAKALKDELLARGAYVKLTREDDTYVGLQDRVDFANNEDSSIFISLHGNALPDTMDPISNNGTEIYYYYPQARPLAGFIMASMVGELGARNHGIIQHSFAVVRNTNALAILLEIGYLINPDDNSKIIDSAYREKTIQAISNGIENYIKTQR
jgi:N-acetylmuramoyl-L-alanine amidase